MKFRILPSGNLLITADNLDREELAYDLRRGARNSAESTVIENARHGPGCEQYEFISGEELCVITEAPCLAADMTIEDDGACAFYGKVWKFEEYMLRDYLEELAWRGRTVFTLGADFGEEPYKVPPLWTSEYTESPRITTSTASTSGAALLTAVEEARGVRSNPAPEENPNETSADGARRGSRQFPSAPASPYL